MRATLDVETRRLTLASSSLDEVRGCLDGIRSDGGLQVEVDTRLAQYDVVTLLVEHGEAAEVALECYAARIAEKTPGSYETAFVVREWIGGSADEILGRLEGSPAAHRLEQPEQPEQPEADGLPPEGEARGVASVHRVRQMNLSQKAILAQRADRAARQVLLRDNAPQVLQGLLANPRIEAKEILRIAKSTYATGAILQRIAGDSRWGKNQEILAALVRNPKSPTPTITRLVDKLRTSDLRQMAKMTAGLRDVVRKAALREYLKRSGQ